MTICFPRIIDRTAQCPVELLTFSATAPTCVRIVPVRSDELYAVGERPRVHYFVTDDGEVYQLAPTQDDPLATPPRWHALLDSTGCVLVGVEFSNMVQSHILPIQVELLPGVLRIILLQFGLTVADVQNGLPPSQCRPTLFADIIAETTNCLAATPPTPPSLRFGCSDARACFNAGPGVTITGATSPYTINAGVLNNTAPDVYEWTSATGATFQLYPTQRYYLRAGGSAGQFEETRNLLFLRDTPLSYYSALFSQEGALSLPNAAYSSAMFLDRNDTLQSAYSSFVASVSSVTRPISTINSSAHLIVSNAINTNSYTSMMALSNVSTAQMDALFSFVAIDGGNLTTPGSIFSNSIVSSAYSSVTRVRYFSSILLNPFTDVHRDVEDSIASVFILGQTSADRPADQVVRNFAVATFIQGENIRLRNQAVNSRSPFLHVMFGRNANESMSMFQVTENFTFADVDADGGFDFVVAQSRFTFYAYSWPSGSLLFLPAHRGSYNTSTGAFTPFNFANDAAAATSIIGSYPPVTPQVKPGALTMAFVSGRPALFAFDGVQWVRITV